MISTYIYRQEEERKLVSDFLPRRSVPVMPAGPLDDGRAAARHPLLLVVLPGARRVRAGPVRLHLQRPAGGQDRLHR